MEQRPNPVTPDADQLPKTDTEVKTTGITSAEMQRAHTRVAARLGDVASDGTDIVTYGPQP